MRLQFVVEVAEPEMLAGRLELASKEVGSLFVVAVVVRLFVG